MPWLEAYNSDDVINIQCKSALNSEVAVSRGGGLDPEHDLQCQCMRH